MKINKYIFTILVGLLLMLTACDDGNSDSVVGDENIHSVVYTVGYEDDSSFRIIGSGTNNYNLFCSNVLNSIDVTLVTSDITGTEQLPLDFGHEELIDSIILTFTDEEETVSTMNCKEDEYLQVVGTTNYNVQVSFDQERLYNTVNTYYKAIYGYSRVLQINVIEDFDALFTVEFVDS